MAAAISDAFVATHADDNLGYLVVNEHNSSRCAENVRLGNFVEWRCIIYLFDNSCCKSTGLQDDL